MNRSSGSTDLFARAFDYREFVRVLAEGLKRHDVSLLSFCLMPNHWHLVVHADAQPMLSRFMHWISTTHARRWRRRRGTVGLGPVYKGRFLSVALETGPDILRVCRYVERNPFKAGLVTRAEDWPWSSLAERRRRWQRLPLETVDALQSEDWIGYVNDARTLAEVVAMERLDRSVPSAPADPAGAKRRPSVPNLWKTNPSP